LPTLDIQVAASADDCYCYWNGSAWVFDYTYTLISSGYSSATIYKRGGGFRFDNVTVPKGRTIAAAYLRFTSGTSHSETTVNSKITGDKESDAAAFTTLADYQARRGTVVGGANNNYITSKQVNWNNIAAWTLDTPYNSPDISEIIQEIVNQAGWASGNHLVLFWDDHDDLSTHAANTIRNADTYDNSTSKCAILHIEYTTDITVNAPTATVSSQAYATTTTGGAKSSPPTATVDSLALAPIVSVGTNATVNAPAGIVTSLAYAPTVTATRNVTSSPPAATVTSEAYIVVAGPLTGVTVSPPAAIVSSQAYTVSTTVPFHIIWEASYEIDIPQVNRAFIVGEDLAGSLVTANAITQAEVDLVGERLEVQHTPAAITAAVAADVAVAVLGKNRLDGQKGKILIPPHCALELWDVLNVVDTVADQSGSYRVSGYSLEYDVQAGQYQHQLDLSAV
jgi:hypothetical protein